MIPRRTSKPHGVSVRENAKPRSSCRLSRPFTTASKAPVNTAPRTYHSARGTTTGTTPPPRRVFTGLAVRPPRNLAAGQSRGNGRVGDLGGILLRVADVVAIVPSTGKTSVSRSSGEAWEGGGGVRTRRWRCRCCRLPLRRRTRRFCLLHDPNVSRVRSGRAVARSGLTATVRGDVVDGRREAVLGAEFVELLLPGPNLLRIAEARGQRGGHLGLGGHCLGIAGAIGRLGWTVRR